MKSDGSETSDCPTLPSISGLRGSFDYLRSSKQTSKQASKQASKQRTHASKQASKQASGGGKSK